MTAPNLKNPLLVSRAKYDEILTTHPTLLPLAFKECKTGYQFGQGKYQWTLAGVTFFALTSETETLLRSLL